MESNPPFIAANVRVRHVSSLAHEVLQLRPAHALRQPGNADLVPSAGRRASGTSTTPVATATTVTASPTSPTSPVPSTTARRSAVATPLVRLRAREKTTKYKQDIASHVTCLVEIKSSVIFRVLGAWVIRLEPERGVCKRETRQDKGGVGLPRRF